MEIVGTKWKCTDERLEQFGLTGTVIDAEASPDWNGDGDIEIKYSDGSISYMKLRRFLMRHENISE